MNFTFLSIGVLTIIILAFVFVVVTGTFIVIQVFRTFRQVNQVQSHVLQSAGGANEERSQKKTQTGAGDVLRCRQCGAVIDSTAELSAEGAIRCNYCNTWTSLYSPGGGKSS
jgi:DNA-directed RNA polymerase subunit RPC12/RpoP